MPGETFPHDSSSFILSRIQFHWILFPTFQNEIWDVGPRRNEEIKDLGIKVRAPTYKCHLELELRVTNGTGHYDFHSMKNDALKNLRIDFETFYTGFKLDI